MTETATETTTNTTVVLSVRPAALNDVEALTAIWLEAAEAFTKADRRYQLAPDGTTRWQEALRSWLAQPNAAVFVAEKNGKTVGYIVGLLNANPPGLLPAQIGYVSDLAIDFHAKSGGIGRMLLEALTVWFKTKGITQIEARVPYRHPVAQAFWRAMGAQKISEQMWLRLDV